MAEVLSVGFLLAVGVALIAFSLWSAHVQAKAWLEHEEARDRQTRAEREVLYRAILSRTAGEFGSLERIRQQPVKASGRPVMTREEYEDMLREDFRGMGIPDEKVPLVPEGL
jgi:hypothetical protein